MLASLSHVTMLTITNVDLQAARNIMPFIIGVISLERRGLVVTQDSFLVDSLEWKAHCN